MKEQPPDKTFENREKLEKLTNYLRQGFLLHGSKSIEKLDQIDPRQASDTDKERVAGNQFAVYAEKDDVRVPIVMALLSKKDESKGGWHSFYHGDENGFRTGGTNAEFTPGLVYVLPPDSFETILDEKRSGKEHISRKPVVPVDAVEVDQSILDLLDIEVEFKD